MSASNKQTNPNKKAGIMPPEMLKDAISLFKIPSTGDNENLISIFISKSLGELEYSIDGSGNIMVIKGNGPYPCFCAHLDTVHDYDNGFNVAVENVADRVMLCAYDNNKHSVGVGGDDKCGIFVCLQLLKFLDSCKIVFFSKEESGGIGSSNIDLQFFSDCKFIAGIDRWNGQDLITTYGGSKTVSEKFLKAVNPMLREFGYRENTGMFTDCFNLFDRNVGLSCVNISCGYYMHHSDNEYVDTNELYHCLKFCLKLSEIDVFKHNKPKNRYDNWRTKYSFNDKIYKRQTDDYYCKSCGYVLLGCEVEYCSSCEHQKLSWKAETYCDYCGCVVSADEEISMLCCNACYKIMLEGDIVNEF